MCEHIPMHAYPRTIRPLLLELAAVPSVSPNGETERAAARLLRDYLKDTPYFRSAPEDLRLLPIEGDALEREVLFALVRSPKRTEDTIILTGHLDVVGTKVCGPLAPLAFDPEAYTARIGEMPISPSARRDLESGEWLFGRGVADMKCGVAAATALLESFARDPSTLETNVALLVVPDEENSSLGMLGAVRHLARFQEGGLRFLLCLNTEPSIGIGDDASRLAAVYTGSAGKINPFFLMLGREAHLGEYYEGLSSALMLAELELLLEGDPALADSGGGEGLTPFACMKHRDLRGEYSASVPEGSVAYYSYFTATRLPGEILGTMRALALEAQRRAISRTEASAARFAEMGKPLPAALGLRPRVLSYGEVRAAALERAGDTALAAAEKAALARLPPDADERDRALALVEGAVAAAGEKGSLAVVGFLMPWYPHIGNAGATANEKAALALAGFLADRAADHGRALAIRPFYEGISDLSYCAAPCAPAELVAYTENCPGYGSLYELPLEALGALRIPVLNLGPIGKDAHKLSERIHEPYAFREYPELLRLAVERAPLFMRDVH